MARALLGDVTGAAIAALFGAAAATIAILFLARLRLFLHDFRHLPVVRSGTPGQATALALALLALPFVFRLGPFALLFAGALAAWAYLSRWERVAVTASLLALVAIPWLAAQAVRITAWQGTLADDVHEMETGWPTPAFVAEMKERSERESFRRRRCSPSGAGTSARATSSRRGAGTMPRWSPIPGPPRPR